MDNFDKLIECSRCGSDACYVQELGPKFQLEYCMGCGFQSNTAYSNAELLTSNLNVLPTIYKILIDQEEDTLKIWIPAFVNVQDVGMIYANGNSRENWWWEAGKFDPKTPGKIKTSELKKFEPTKGFMEALDYLGLLG